MPNLEITLEQVIAFVKQLTPEEQLAVFSVLSAELEHKSPDLDRESQEWLEAEFGEELPPYEWGMAGIPVGQPVRYVPGEGLLIEEDKLHG